MSNVSFFISILVAFFLAGSVAMADSNPEPKVWMSPPISLPLRSVALMSLRSPQQRDIVAMSAQEIVIYERAADALSQVDRYVAPSKSEAWIRLYPYDLDGDGKSELAVTAFHYGKPKSFILKWNGVGAWQRVVDDIPYVISVKTQAGKSLLLGQKRYYKDGFQGPMVQLSYVNGELTETPFKDIPKNLDVFGVEFITMDGGENILALRSSGYVELYAKERNKWRRRWGSGEKYGGATEFIAKTQETVFNEVLSDRLFFQPDIGVISSSRELVVMRNSDYLKRVVGKEPSIKWSQLYRFEWSGIGFRQVWESEPFDGKITDLKIVDLDGDTTLDIAACAQLRDNGYLGGLKDQQSSVIFLYEF